MPSSSARVFDFPAGSTMNSLVLEPPNPPPPAYRFPLESRAIAHKNATDGSKISFTTGASASRPSLASERRVNVPFSKSAISPCCQVLVSTAHNVPKAHKNAPNVLEMCMKSVLFDVNFERITAADHLIDRDGKLFFSGLKRPGQHACRGSLRLQYIQYGRRQTGQRFIVSVIGGTTFDQRNVELAVAALLI